jgi:hypothetical protein
MTTATPSQHAVAQWLLTAEGVDPERPLAVPAAAERVFGKLSRRLAQLITLVGSDALLARAVHLSRAEFPFLDGMQTTPSADGLTLRLRESAEGVESSQAAEAFEAVLAILIALLISFVGEDLSLRVLREVWPELPMPQSVQPTRQNGTGNLEVSP